VPFVSVGRVAASTVASVWRKKAETRVQFRWSGRQDDVRLRFELTCGRQGAKTCIVQYKIIWTSRSFLES